MSSNSQVVANQANAQLSTGPSSPEGKAASSLNALKHGAYSQSRVLPGENADDLAALERDFAREFDPQGPVESALVETIVRNQWLLRRFDRLESIVTWKYVADSGKSEDEALADLFLQTKNNPLTKIQRQRDAAQRHWFRALKELQRLQKLRKKEDPAANQKIGFVPKPAEKPASPVWKAPVPTPDPSR